MGMNNPNTQLKDCIHVEKGIIPSYLCEYIIGDINKREWISHTWHNTKKDLIIQDWETRFPQSFDELSNLYVFKDNLYRGGQLYSGGPRDYESSPLNLLKQRNCC